MGKKAVSHQSLLATKISKKDDQKYQFQSLIKVLKPKVYITESSNFMRLVQELTGDGNSSTWSPPSMETPVAKGVVVNRNDSVHCNQITDRQFQYQSSSSSSTVETSSGNNSSFTFDHRLPDHQQSEYQYQSCSMEVSDSMDASTGSPVSSYTTNASDQEYYLLNLQFPANETALQEFMTNELVDLFAYQEIESFLMDDSGTPSLYNCLA